MLGILTAMAALLLVASPSLADILINEVLYDPEGPDSGYEFVELMAVNEGANLEGLRLEFCNGSDPGTWRTLWTGLAGVSLSAGALFLIGEEAVDPAPQAVVSLGLQNGPEALRIVRGEEILDLLGYGPELSLDLCEAWPAGDAPSGKSLARMPDGVDTNQNVLDFFARDPSPGALNDPDLALDILSARLPIPPPGSGEAWTLRVEVENLGRLPWGEAPTLSVGSASMDLPRLEPGHSGNVDIRLHAPGPGPDELLIVAGGRDIPPDSLPLPYHVGFGPLLLSEVQFAPLTGRSEWVECLAPEGLSATGPWTLMDLSGASASFAPPALAPGERILLCQNREGVLQDHPGLPAARVLELDPWPSLANLGESWEWPPWTDGLRLRDETGLDSDGMLYHGEWITEKGRSLERLRLRAVSGASAWAPCALGSTPLAGPDPAASPREGAWSLEPQPFDPAREVVEFVLRENGEAARLRLFDAVGRPVQEIPGELSTGTLRLLWDGRDESGRDLPSGAYPFQISWRRSRGGEAHQRGVCLLLRSGP